MVHLDAIWIKVCFPCPLTISRISCLMLIMHAHIVAQVLKNTMRLIWDINVLVLGWPAQITLKSLSPEWNSVKANYWVYFTLATSFHFYHFKASCDSYLEKMLPIYILVRTNTCLHCTHIVEYIDSRLGTNSNYNLSFTPCHKSWIAQLFSSQIRIFLTVFTFSSSILYIK